MFVLWTKQLYRLSIIYNRVISFIELIKFMLFDFKFFIVKFYQVVFWHLELNRLFSF